MSTAQVKEFFDGLEAKVNGKPDRVAGVSANYAFKIGEGAWGVAIGEGKAAVSTGEPASPSCTITMTDDDFLALLEGRLNGQMAFMTGKLKVGGDFSQALKLEAFLK